VNTTTTDNARTMEANVRGDLVRYVEHADASLEVVLNVVTEARQALHDGRYLGANTTLDHLDASMARVRDLIMRAAVASESIRTKYDR
jgi:hypothetical protein